MRLRAMAAGGWPLCLSLLLLSPVTGCGLLRSASKVPGEAVQVVTPGKKGPKTMDPVEAQNMLLRFTDEFTAQVIVGIEKLRYGTNEVGAADQLQWKIMVSTETTAIASGPNPIANLLDMTVLVTVSRISVEEHWKPDIFGESAEPLLESCRNSEKLIWQLVGNVLKPEQQKELRQAIEEWRRQNPQPSALLATRAVGFAAQVAKANQGSAAKSGSVFDLLNLDPLAGLDPAVREITQTRLFAERALFVAQRMPKLLRWQTELLSMTTLDLPSVQQLITNSTEIASAVNRFATVAEKLPGQISAEREQIVKDLESQEKNLLPLLNETRQTLATGTAMSTSLNTTLITFDALMKRFGVGETNNASPPDTNSPPFNILDYARTAAQLEATAKQLTELLDRVDQTIASTNLTQLSTQAESSGKHVVDYAFWRAVMFVGVLLLAFLIYRYVSARLLSGRK